MLHFIYSFKNILEYITRNFPIVSHSGFFSHSELIVRIFHKYAAALRFLPSANANDGYLAYRNYIHNTILDSQNS